MGKIIIYREKSIYDGVLPYTCHLNEETFKIYPGKTIEIELKKEVNHFQIRYLYFKTQKIKISPGSYYFNNFKSAYESIDICFSGTSISYIPRIRLY